MSTLEFSVIIPVHSRREFLRSAVASVLAQSIPRSEYEIVVVKNFDDAECDRFLSDQGVLSVRTESEGLGAKLEEALAESRAKIVTFLEDDDLYAPDRLAVVGAAFADPQLGYFHNAVRIINREGAPLPAGFRAETRRSARLEPGDRSPRALRRFLRVSPYFNLSSIALRREALAPALPYLGRTHLTCDNLVFYSALSGTWGLVNHGNPLTFYRLHRSASWTYPGSPEFFVNEARKWNSLVHGFEMIVEMTRDGPAGPYAQGELLESRAMHALAAEPEEVAFPAREVPRLVGRRLRGFSGISVPLATIGLAIRAVAPDLERRLYATYLRTQTAQLGVA
jgi:glycosyltransferase involved in cell wall biosynthesis